MFCIVPACARDLLDGESCSSFHALDSSRAASPLPFEPDSYLLSWVLSN